MADFLYREFCNHAYLGQWELARACAVNFMKNYAHSEKDTEMFISTVYSIAKDPYLARSAWPSFPSPNYVTFLSCQLLSDLGYQEECKTWRNNADFNILLEKILESPERILKELSDVFSRMTTSRSYNEDKNLEITNECILALKSAFKEHPFPVSLLLTKMCCFSSFKTDFSLTSIFHNMHLQLLVNTLKSAESSKDNPQLLLKLTSKVYLLLSLFPDLDSNESNISELNNLFASCSNLCESGVLKLEKVYSSLLGHSSPNLLKYFCNLENMKLISRGMELNNTELCKLSFLNDSGSFNHRLSLLWSLSNETHMLQNLMEYCIKNMLIGNWKHIVSNLNDFPPSLKHLFLILSWRGCSNDDTLNVMEVVKMWNECAEDTSIAAACKRLKLNVSLSQMCISNYIELFPNAEPQEISSHTRRIFSYLQTQSVLKVLHSVFGLKNIPPEKLKNILKYNQENLYSATLNTFSYLTDESIYSGYLIIVLIMEAIYLSNEFKNMIEPMKINMNSLLYKTDKIFDAEIYLQNIIEIDMLDFISKYGHQKAYSKFIVEKLETARQRIRELFPLSFRVEILENIFSLLFLMAQNLIDFMEQHYDSDQGYEGEVLYEKNESIFIHSVNTEKIFEGRFVLSTAKLKDTPVMKNENMSDHISSKSESATSNGFHSYTFLCNELITRDLLSFLKDCALEAKAEVYKLIAGQDSGMTQEDLKTAGIRIDATFPDNNSELPERTSRLLQYINESIWRYEVVKTDIFQDRIGFYEQQRNKPYLFQSQFSTSSSEGTDKETKKHRKKKRHKCNSLSQKDESVAESSIIQCMLSSPEALLRYSLWNKNLKQAGQVIQLFKLENSNEAKEVTLINDLQNITNKLKANDKGKERSFKKNSSVDGSKAISSNISSIKSAVTFGLYSSNIYKTLIEELSSLGVLKTVDITGGIRHPELLLGSKNIFTLLLIDVAYVTDISIELASSLLDSASKSWVDTGPSIKELDAKVLSRKKMPLIRGNSKTLNMMNSLLKEMLIFLKSTDSYSDLGSIFWPLKKQFTNLSQVLPYFLGNFNHRRFSEEVTNWKTTCSLIEEFSILLDEEELNEIKGILVKDIIRENKLHMTYKKLSQTLRELRDWSSRTIRPEVLHYDNYLSKLFIHLRQVTTAALECKNQNIHSGTSSFYASDFSILKESPVELVKKIILHSGVTPEKTEKFAVRMKVDLVRVLAQACLPYVPLCKENSSIDKLFRSSCQMLDQGYPIYVLNSARQTWPEPRHPDLVARELLRDLISMIQDTTMVNDTKGIFRAAELFSLTQHSQLADWMEECSQLAFVNLDLLQTREEKLAFFINVNNIAWLYAIILQTLLGKSQEKEKEENETPDYSDSNSDNKTDYSQELLLSPNILERLAVQKILGFSIGQLGPISLFDLRYQFLHDQLPVPKHLNTPPFQKLLGDKNPSWEKYMPVPDTRLLFVLIEGLKYSPKLQVVYSDDIEYTLEKAMKDYFDFAICINFENDTAVLPLLLEWYVLDFDKDDDNSFDKAPYEGLINFLSTLVRPPLSQKFQELLSEDSAYNFSENIDSSGRKQLPFNLEFHGPAPTLGIALEYCTSISADTNHSTTKNSHLIDPQPTIINYLKEKCYILTDLYAVIISGNPSEYLSQLNTNIPVFNLLKHYDGFNIRLDYSYDWFSSALSPYPDKRFFIQQVEFCCSVNNWHDALLYLDVYLEYCGKREFSMELSRQLILEYISGTNPSASTFEPSSCALCITDPLCRANVVLQNVNKWSEYSALKALKYCLSDDKILDFPNMHQSLKHKLREIMLYKKIVDASEMYGSSEVKDCVYVFNNWQEVADCSVWDQSRILDFLDSCEKYDLAVEWSELNIINCKQKIVALSMNLLWQLSQPSPNEQSLKMLDSLDSSSDCLKLCDIVLPKLSSIEAKLCLIQYIVDNISCDNQHYYHNMLLGLKMLSSLKSSAKETYADLSAHPYLLLEQMLMNAELKDAEKALKVIENDLQSLTDIVPVMNMSSVNQLVEDYASKALEVHFLDALLDTSSSSTLVLSIEDSVVADEPFVMPVRVPSKEEWIPDAKIHRCQVCKEEHFNMFNRRHHCRRCGRVVCANCSQHALIVEGYGNIKVRVCEDCYNQMTGSISVTSSSFDKRYRILSSMQSSPRNSPYQENVGSRRRNSLGLQQAFRWVLSSDSEQNASVRNEFSYEQAPSISLCYSILKLHSDSKKCAQFMLNLCDRLWGKIKPRRSGKIPIEVDYSLIISMIKSLLISAKVKCHQVHDSDGEALADLYSQHLDIMKLLVNANCRHLIPREAMTSSDTVRKLRDKLLEEERMNLALEVSTKFNLDKTGVWSSWGLFCIRAGDLSAARTKFQQCLKVINDKNDPKQENPLINKILEVLENSKYAGTEKAAAIYKSLSYLKNIENGSNWLKNENSAMNGLIKKECLYYLNAYGTHFTTIRFYQRNNITCEALNYIIEKKCEPDVFINAVFIPMMKKVQLSLLKRDLTTIDPTLAVWWNYLFATCRYLEGSKYLNVLFEMQLFMEDYARAAKSAINFYLAPASSYEDLFERHRYLYNARKYYERFLNDNKEVNTSGIPWRNKNVKVLPIKEVESYIKIIALQEQVMRFFQQCVSQNSRASLFESKSPVEKNRKIKCLPTLFGNSQKKFEVALMVILNAVNIDEGFELAIKIIQMFGLDTTALLCEAGKELVKISQKAQIPHFLACVKCFFSRMVKVDEVILECVSEINKQKGDVEDIIKMLTSDVNKINAYLMCDKLKSAYLLAIKLKSALDVRRVLVAAEQSGQAAIQQICKKWLESNSQLKLKQ